MGSTMTDRHDELEELAARERLEGILPLVFIMGIAMLGVFTVLLAVAFGGE